MQINTTLSKQDILAIAIKKGWSEIISETQVNGGMTQIVEVSNPLAPEEFLQRVYEQYIIDDATVILTETKVINLKEQIASIEETTRQAVEASVRE